MIYRARWISIAFLGLAMAVLALVATLASIDVGLLRPLILEDGALEYSQFALLLAGAALLAITAVRWFRAGGGGIAIGGAMLLAAVAFFAAAGEEVSWGQRVLGLQTPPDWKAINEQSELNLHNVRGVKGAMETWIKRGVAMIVLLGTAALALNIRRVRGLWVPSAAVMLTLMLAASLRDYGDPYRTAVAVYLCAPVIIGVFAWRREWAWVAASVAVVALSAAGVAASVLWLAEDHSPVINEFREFLEIGAACVYAAELRADAPPRSRPAGTPAAARTAANRADSVHGTV